jgi:hypothetical protein
MSGHLLGDFQLAAILQISRDAGGAKGVAADFGLDSGRERPPADHPPHIGLEQGIAGQLAGPAALRAEESAFPIVGNAGSGDVLLQIPVEIVVRGHLVLLAALFVEPHPAPPALHKHAHSPAREGRSLSVMIAPSLKHASGEPSHTIARCGLGLSAPSQLVGVVNLRELCWKHFSQLISRALPHFDSQLDDRANFLFREIFWGSVWMEKLQ